MKALLKQALDALENSQQFVEASANCKMHHGWGNQLDEAEKAIEALRAAIEQDESEPKCNHHPDAPHGFNRNASHNAKRYVCDCEGWLPDDIAHPEDEPIGMVIPCTDMHMSVIATDERYTDKGGVPVYMAPVGYVPLSEWKLKELWETECPDEHFCSQYFDFAKAIERAVRNNK